MSTTSVFAQSTNKHSIGLQWELPVQAGLRYDYQIIDRISVSAQAGLLREPNATMIVEALDGIGVDELTTGLIESAFKSGLILEEGANFHFKRAYTGIFLQQIFLVGEETPSELVEILLEEDLTTLPRRPGRNNPLEDVLTLNSNLFQMGILYGRVCPLSKGFEIFSEIGISMNVASNSSLESGQIEIESLNEELDAFLKDIYTSYAFIPSFSVGISRKF